MLYFVVVRFFQKGWDGEGFSVYSVIDVSNVDSSLFLGPNILFWA